MSSSTRTVRVRDGAVMVQEWGASRGSARTTVVLVHGIGVSHRYFGPLARVLASETVRVLAPDLPGFGRSARPSRPFEVEDHARLLAVVLEELDATASGPVVLLGHSMGCQVATELAARRPDLVEQLVLVGPVADPAARSAARQAWRLLRDAPHEPWSANSIMLTDWIRTGPRWYARTLPTLLGYPLEDRLPAVAAPVTLVRGEHDPVCPAPYLTDLAEQVLSVSGAPVPVVEVPGEGHIAMYRRPARVAALCLPGREVEEEDAAQPAPQLASQLATLVRHGWWWAQDYLYAGLAQLRGWRGHSEAGEYLDPPTQVGPDVVLVPGVYEPWPFMRPLAVLLHAQGHRVHVLPELGYHRAPVPSGAAVLGAALRERGLRDVVLVAHSKGGLVGKLAMLREDPDGRVARMVAVSTPFGGSVRARWFPGRTMRAFSPRDATVLALTAEHEVNARIVSAYSRFDPHIPGGSELEGAVNVQLRTPGHFRVLADPALAELVLSTLAEVRGARGGASS